MIVSHHFFNIVLWGGKSLSFILVSKVIFFKIVPRSGGFGDVEIYFNIHIELWKTVFFKAGIFDIFELFYNTYETNKPLKIEFI